MVIGLTGKYCAGKNAAEEIFIERGIPCIDVDKLGHLALSARVDAVEEAFGSEVISISPKGSERFVDRKALGAKVFSSTEALNKLEAIVHPWMKEEASRQIDEYLSSGAMTVIVNAAILHKMKLDELCDSIIWVEAPLCIRIRRGLERDGSGIFSVLKKIYTQKELKPKPSLNSVDIYKVDNGSNIEALKRELDIVLSNIEQKGRDGR